MKIEQIDMTIDNAKVVLSGDIDLREYQALATADYNKEDLTIISSSDLYRLREMAYLDTELTLKELFLLEMAVDEILCKLKDDTKMYITYFELNRKLLNVEKTKETKVLGKENE